METLAGNLIKREQDTSVRSAWCKFEFFGRYYWYHVNTPSSNRASFETLKPLWGENKDGFIYWMSHRMESMSYYWCQQNLTHLLHESSAEQMPWTLSRHWARNGDEVLEIREYHYLQVADKYYDLEIGHIVPYAEGKVCQFYNRSKGQWQECQNQRNAQEKCVLWMATKRRINNER